MHVYSNPREMKVWRKMASGRARTLPSITAAIAGLFVPHAALAQSVTPLLSFAEIDEINNLLNVHWGYNNPFELSVFFPIDADENGFNPVPAGRGQPVEFLPGLQEDVFVTPIAGNTTIFWVLDGQFEMASFFLYDTPTDINNSLVLPTGSGLKAPGLTITNGGELSTVGGSAYSVGSTTIDAGGQCSITNDVIDVGDLSNAGSLVVSDSTITGPVTNHIGSTIDINGTVVFSHSVTGSGEFLGGGTARFEGGFSPGLETGVTSFAGSTAFGMANTLTIELGGLRNGEFDRLEIGGDALLDGLLDVSVLSSFAPTVGDEFEILDVTGTQTGQFAGLAEGATIDPGNGNLLLQLSYLGGDGNDVILTVVPAPSTLLLLGLGALGTTRRR